MTIKIKIATVIVLMQFCFVSCKTNNDETLVSLNTNIMDLDSVKLGKNATANFYIKNIGNKDLYITDVVPDCYCTIPTWDKKGISSNDSTKITVVVKKDFTGIFQQVVKVACNTKEKTLLLVVRGKFIK